MSEVFTDFLADRQQHIDQLLHTLLTQENSEFAPAQNTQLQRLFEACQYSVSNGGKRIRPLLAYGAAHAIKPGPTSDAVDYAAAAIELMHSYSLVHDDLPAMDDDDLRRGKPSCHKAYDEATAVLVGDALQCRAFELITQAPGVGAPQQVAMVQILAAAAGPRGMVGGQAIDVAAIDSDLPLERLQAMHSLKTGALIRAALALGGLAAGADPQQLAALDNYGRPLGLAFQVVDDILDVESDTVTLGKTQGKDSDANKPTYVKLLGAGGAKKAAQELLDEAQEALAPLGRSSDKLAALAEHIVKRDH